MGQRLCIFSIAYFPKLSSPCTLSAVLSPFKVQRAACAANQTFAQVAGTASYVLPATNLRKAEHTISSSNSLMNSESANYREYVRWVKGGFTTLAGRCIVAFAEKDGHTYGLVILGCDTPDHLFAECDDLFDWAFASFADRPLVDTLP